MNVIISPAEFVDFHNFRVAITPLQGDSEEGVGDGRAEMVIGS